MGVHYETRYSNFYYDVLGFQNAEDTERELANSLISRITANPTAIAEGVLIEDESDVAHYKDIFERIFRAMDQQPHFDMMIESVNWHDA